MRIVMGDISNIPAENCDLFMERQLSYLKCLKIPPKERLEIALEALKLMARDEESCSDPVAQGMIILQKLLYEKGYISKPSSSDRQAFTISAFSAVLHDIKSMPPIQRSYMTVDTPEWSSEYAITGLFSNRLVRLSVLYVPALLLANLFLILILYLIMKLF
jgi:hypothetical protein